MLKLSQMAYGSNNVKDLHTNLASLMRCLLQVFHAGTARDADGNILAAGGRVLGISATGKDVLEAQQKAYHVRWWPLHVAGVHEV